ncbi:Lactonase, 7-bladed beta-propeller-domain-containing protein [Mucidula mucida]|nr:Lactonase, 7-bladed beta-propeller-domain-containing protein [Mucidula mucida]
MVKLNILAGGYTSYIVSYLFDSDSGALSYLCETPTEPNPSWLFKHNNRLIYGVNEIDNGTLTSYAFFDGRLSIVDSISSGGIGPAYCSSLSDGNVPIMNYGSGDGLLVSTALYGYELTTTSNLITFEPPVNGTSFPHMTLQYDEEVLVTDLGADKIWRVGQDTLKGTWTVHGALAHDTGSGPRHMVVSNDTLYVLHEKTNTLTKEVIPPTSSLSYTSQLLANVTIVPSDVPYNSTYAAAELLLASEYLYASNRNIGGTPDPRGDSIAIFDLNLKLVRQVFTGLVNIRGMIFGGENDAYLVALGAVSGGMVVYERLGDDLVEVARNSSAVARTTAVVI